MNLPGCILMIVTVSTVLTAQQTSLDDRATKLPLPSVLPLQSAGEATITSEVAFGYFGPARCQEGNVYVRPIPPDASPLIAPVVRINAGGKSSARFDLREVPSLLGKEFVAPGYAVDQFGRVYFVVRLVDAANHHSEKTTLVRFSKNGNYLSETTLDRTIWPYSLAIFSDGSFFVAGVAAAPYEHERAAYEPSEYLIFDAEGHVVRNLKTRDPFLEPEKTKGLGAINPAVQYGDAVVEGDQLYLLKYGSVPIVEIWTAAGQQLKSIKLPVPVKDATTSNLIVASGKMSVEFHGPAVKNPSGRPSAETIWGIYDTNTGDVTGFYGRGSVRGRAVCLQRDGFLFLVAKSDHFALSDVKPE
ncbi:MAG: hypothetical protein ACR2IF_11945 [Terriglobales bacterium]